MTSHMLEEKIISLGASSDIALIIMQKLSQQYLNPEEKWFALQKDLVEFKLPFLIHLFIFKNLFPDWFEKPHTAPAWQPTFSVANKTHLAKWMNQLEIKSVKEFHTWSFENYNDYWKEILNKIGIIFNELPKQIVSIPTSIENVEWLPGAKFNIVESCFKAASDTTAIVYLNRQDQLVAMSYGELNNLVNQIANSLTTLGFSKGDAIAIDMPMTEKTVGIYLAIIKIGAVVVSIADSFSSVEIQSRLKIAKTKAIFTQDFILRDLKKIPLYEKVCKAEAPLTIVLPCEDRVSIPLRPTDLVWDDFISDNIDFTAVNCDAKSHCNILFSSGTTGEPKAIPWNHSTPIKTAADAYIHLNINSNDILAWPTNLGWMMGPWLIFAAFMNNAAIALYNGNPKEKKFGEFIQNTKVTMLGVVPTLVAYWRDQSCMEGFDWQNISRFSSTGECSNPEDMLYLMSLAGYKPIIEYCGGTEIGGAYITSTLIEKNYPSVFSTKAMGNNFILLDQQNNESMEGEVALIPPAMGLSQELLNFNHHQIYYVNMPKKNGYTILRRHGDQIKQLPNGFYQLMGRVDDTMNLGGIKISSAEIERAITIDEIQECAAVAHQNKSEGISHLIIFAVPSHNHLESAVIKNKMQQKINELLNPLFKISEVIFVNELPKTASNKIMRRLLRDRYALE